MNGKPKSESMFDEFSNLIKSTNYYYRDNNEVLLGDSNGIEKGIVGVEWDMVVDARTSKQDTYVPSIEVNMDNFFVPPMPAPIFVILPFPSFQRSYVKYSSIATTKTVQRNGILDKVIVYDKGSTLSTRNLLYDKNTGSVLVAATNNEFKDTVYTTNIPAYWNHKRMGLAMHNEGFGFSNLVGDQVLVNKDGYKLAWNLGNNIYRSSGGEKIENPEIIKVLKSGYTNQLSQSSGTIITLKNPIQENKLKFDKILDANATSYRDMWQLYQYKNHEFRKTKCECSETNVETWIGLINSVLSDMAMRVKIINNSTSYKIKKDKKLTKWNIFIDKYD
ncbi:MAG: hypothetical protein IPL98_13070 [Saprospiraceae bacterium]|nr:hypothetical protein [Saprospiraceae bacterium]